MSRYLGDMVVSGIGNVRWGRKDQNNYTQDRERCPLEKSKNQIHVEETHDTNIISKALKEA